MSHKLGTGRGLWLQAARGAVTLNGTALGEGDGIDFPTGIEIVGCTEAEVLFFDVAA